MVIFLQIPTIIRTDGRITPVSYLMCVLFMMLGRKMQTAEPLKHEPCPFEVEIARAIKLTVIIIEGYHCHQLHKKIYPIFLSDG